MEWIQILLGKIKISPNFKCVNYNVKKKIIFLLKHRIIWTLWLGSGAHHMGLMMEKTERVGNREQMAKVEKKMTTYGFTGNILFTDQLTKYICPSPQNANKWFPPQYSCN